MVHCIPQPAQGWRCKIGKSENQLQTSIHLLTTGLCKQRRTDWILWHPTRHSQAVCPLIPHHIKQNHPVGKSRNNATVWLIPILTVWHHCLWYYCCKDQMDKRSTPFALSKSWQLSTRKILQPQQCCFHPMQGWLFSLLIWKRGSIACIRW